MPFRFSGLFVKLKLFLPIFLGIIVAVTLFTLISIRISKREIRSTIANNLQLEVRTITKMFERERNLKFDKVKNDLKVLHSIFYSFKLKISQDQYSRIITNQNTHQYHRAG
jgi:hypothetical protein